MFVDVWPQAGGAIAGYWRTEQWPRGHREVLGSGGHVWRLHCLAPLASNGGRPEIECADQQRRPTSQDASSTDASLFALWQRQWSWSRWRTHRWLDSSKCNEEIAPGGGARSSSDGLCGLPREQRPSRTSLTRAVCGEVGRPLVRSFVRVFCLRMVVSPSRHLSSDRGPGLSSEVHFLGGQGWAMWGRPRLTKKVSLDLSE